jgi:hypothetical protein
MPLHGKDFYRGFDDTSQHRTGLTVGYGGATRPGRGALWGGSGRRFQVINGYRGYRFPGLLTPERGAMAVFPVPDPAGISDNSTLTLEDGIATRIYEFDSDGSGLTVGDVLVDIQAAVTELDLASALAVAINADNAEIFMTAIVKVRAGQVFLGLKQQAFLSPGVPGWFTQTGLGATGRQNPQISASDPGEWPGLPAEMTGGKGTLPGVSYVPVLQAAQIRLCPFSTFTKGVATSVFADV